MTMGKQGVVRTSDIDSKSNQDKKVKVLHEKVETRLCNLEKLKKDCINKNKPCK